MKINNQLTATFTFKKRAISKITITDHPLKERGSGVNGQRISFAHFSYGT